MAMLLFGTTLLSYLTFTRSFTTDWTTEFEHNTFLDEDNTFKLYWSNLENDIIEFGIEAQATGWISLGISPNGQMPGSDIALGWVRDDGVAILQDRYTVERTAPFFDDQQDLTLISGEEADGWTRLRFTRSTASCDENDLDIVKGTSRLIWAFHVTDDPETECFEGGGFAGVGFHTNKGTQTVNLDTGIPEVVELEDDVETFDVLLDNVQVPATDTTYWCKVIELPKFDDEIYAVKFEPVVEEGNEALVHHMVIFYCPEYLVFPEANGQSGADSLGVEEVCDAWNQNMPSAACRSERVLYIWAIGGNALYMPQEAALPLGGGSGVHYIMMEMHYDNPALETDRIDSSGFRVTYTKTPRKYNVGVLALGAVPSWLGQVIPPGQSSAFNQYYIPRVCSKYLPEDGINVFGSFLHAHAIGQALKMRVIRDGKELSPLDMNEAFDADYQQTVVFNEHIKLYQDDFFILQCWSDSTERVTFTTGGEPSFNEMCLNYLFYYPEMKWESSFSIKHYPALLQFLSDAVDAGYLDVGDFNFTEAAKLNVFAGDEIDFSEFAWDTTKEGHEEFYNRFYDPAYPQYNLPITGCDGAGLNGSDVDFNLYPIPTEDQFEVYVEPEAECSDTVTTMQCVETPTTTNVGEGGEGEGEEEENDENDTPQSKVGRVSGAVCVVFAAFFVFYQ